MTHRMLTDIIKLYGFTMFPVLPPPLLYLELDLEELPPRYRPPLDPPLDPPRGDATGAAIGAFSAALSSSKAESSSRMRDEYTFR